MPVIVGKAPGKIILFGEHAVVYGQPAIAIPVNSVKATAHIAPIIDSSQENVHIFAPDIGLNTILSKLDEDHPIAKAIGLTLEKIRINHIPAFSLQVTSTIPVAAGMGSGAAISVAIIRAVSGFFGISLPLDEVSAITFEVEKIHHGNPSGIDNTVVTYQRPILFMRENPIQFLKINLPIHWIIADSGEKTPTHKTVEGVRKLHASDITYYDEIFQKIGRIVTNARQALEDGDIDNLGLLMNENQRYLSKLEVTNPKLDSLIKAARSAGALGAKLSGGGKGGNIIALAQPNHCDDIEDALLTAGAVRIIRTILSDRGTA